MKYSRTWLCITLGISVLVILAIAAQDETNLKVELAYSTTKFNEGFETGKVVFVSITSDWDGNALANNREMLSSDKWLRFFEKENVALLLYDRTDGIAHEELNLKDGGAYGLLAVYSKQLGRRPLVTILGGLEVEHLNELVEFIESSAPDTIASTTKFETSFTPTKVFSHYPRNEQEQE